MYGKICLIFSLPALFFARKYKDQSLYVLTRKSPQSDGAKAAFYYREVEKIRQSITSSKDLQPNLGTVAAKEHAALYRYRSF
jgi:hypothetical protein